ncbi:type II toxin-antitoxin system Phd/YefM family antitoxin [Catenuloplanes sp. NPDC051500]|uniref:type II toxin-antitoxin system Phd/YefM family antitoxin n=1 Tax=Catenuloplanes sp. NPDC051500 TaxID=3363959 RepID=UPI00379BD2D0
MNAMLPLAEVRDRLSTLVTSVEQTHERIIITRNGRPAAVLIAVSDLETLTVTPGRAGIKESANGDEPDVSIDQARTDSAARG